MYFWAFYAFFRCISFICCSNTAYDLFIMKNISNQKDMKHQRSFMSVALFAWLRENLLRFTKLNSYPQIVEWNMRSIFKFPIISHYRSVSSLMSERYFGTIFLIFSRQISYNRDCDVHNILSTKSRRYSRNSSSNNIFVLLLTFF